jgi:hypothetical protein
MSPAATKENQMGAREEMMKMEAAAKKAFEAFGEAEAAYMSAKREARKAMQAFEECAFRHEETPGMEEQVKAAFEFTREMFEATSS